jgi:hypothetical protein
MLGEKLLLAVVVLVMRQNKREKRIPQLNCRLITSFAFSSAMSQIPSCAIFPGISIDIKWLWPSAGEHLVGGGFS